ncbi:hypothetical protein KAU88_09595 [Candidatus Bathyarchaeota archaeon]|nr:hypothetical protein [Candidatus Bathyarchaeota archaeon]
MKFPFSTLANIFLAGIFLSSMFLIGITTSINSYSALPGEYDPWCDLNDDGDINIYDIVDIAGRYGTTGENITKASIEYDSGWIDITDKAGQYFNITHNLNSTDIIVDIQGKTTINGGVHQRYLGGTDYVHGWNRTYGGASDDYVGLTKCLVQTSDGGYAMAGGFNHSWEPIPSGDAWLVKTDAAGNMQWNKTYGGTGDDWAHSVVQTADGGYVMAGLTDSFGAGSYDSWLIKTDSFGNMQWNQTYGGIGYDTAWTVVQTSDGGYAVIGETGSFGAGGSDMWLIKTDLAGNPCPSFKFGLAWTDSTNDTMTLCRGATDPYWNHVRVRIWKIKETP